MRDLTILVLQFFLRTAVGQIIFSIEYTSPFIYPRTACPEDGVLIHYLYRTFQDCQQLCAANKLCGLMNYNPSTKQCILQGHDASQSSDDGQCISFSMSSDSDVTGLSGACSARPCDNVSVCVPQADSTSHVCALVFCPDPPSIANAVLLQEGTTWIGQRNAYVCDTGYTGTGDPEIQCDESGTWTPTDFACFPYCPPIPVIDTADLVSWSPLRLFTNTIVLYDCKAGLYTNVKHSSIICDETGSWSPFQCLQYCYQKNLPTLVNGAVSPGNRYTVNMTAEYTCDTGYYLSPGRPFLVCDETGAWSELQVQCNRHCPTPPGNPENGYITEMPSQPFVHESPAKFECHADLYSYPIDSDTHIVCHTDGHWTYLAECFKYCESLPSVLWYEPVVRDSVSTGRPYTVDTYVIYKCTLNRYFGAGGNDRKTCTKRGTWQGVVICCSGVISVRSKC